MIKYVVGDIFLGGDDVIVHGCNCWNNFGAGIALKVSEYYPQAYMVDKATKEGDRNKLGSYTAFECDNIFLPNKKITIVNAYTQFYPSVKMKPFDYKAFEEVLPKIRNKFYNKSIAFPKIGCGLAGGSFPIVTKMIKKCFGDIEVKLYVLNEKELNELK